MTTPTCIFVMGVSGAGKTTIGQRLSERMGCHFLDGDDFHSPENIRKMEDGVPLSDDDRWPWLELIVKAIQEKIENPPVVVACSALKEVYRRRLAVIPYHLVYLKGQRSEIESRIQARADHFLPAKLLTSQFLDLEEPQNALVAPVTWTPDDIVAYIIKELFE